MSTTIEQMPSEISTTERERFPVEETAKKLKKDLSDRLIAKGLNAMEGMGGLLTLSGIGIKIMGYMGPEAMEGILVGVSVWLNAKLIDRLINEKK